MDDDLQTEIARMRAEMDQAVEAVKQMARGVKSFYSTLREEGFDESQAMRLTCAFVRNFARGGSEE